LLFTSADYAIVTCDSGAMDSLVNSQSSLTTSLIFPTSGRQDPNKKNRNYAYQSTISGSLNFFILRSDLYSGCCIIPKD